jgi:hypothetical protein
MSKINNNLGNEDPLIEEQVEQTVVRHNDDILSIRMKLEREYSSPETAIEDYRRGYLSEEYLAIRFTPDEIDFIHEKRDERDEEEKKDTTGTYL